MSARWRAAILCVLGITAGSAGLGVSLPLLAQDSSSCPLTLKQQVDSIHAFADIASFLTQEPRCVNCHGGVNPFIDGTGSDPDDEAAPKSRTAHGGGRIRRQRETAPDGTVLIESECMDCHNEMVPRRDGSKSVWMTAPGFLSFVDKDAPTLCKQIKRSTRTATEFMGHLKDDNGGNNFGGTAFKGDRALDKDRYDIPPAPPSISHTDLMRLGQAWVNAMDGSFQGDESCGCTVELEGQFSQKQQMAMAPSQFAAYGISATADYRTQGRLVWTSDPDSAQAHTFGDVASLFYVPTDGEITVTVDTEGKSAAGSCTYEGSKTFPIKSLPPAALEYLQLELAADGRYRLMLGMISKYLQFEVKRNCRIPVAPGFGGGTEIVNAAGIAIGKQEGTIVDDAVAGHTAAPITMGPISITGDWQFKSSPPSRP